MKIRKDERISTINVMPGDSIQLEYTDEFGRRQVVAEDTITRSMRVDRAIIFEVDEAEREALGLADGIGGIFGTST